MLSRSDRDAHSSSRGWVSRRSTLSASAPGQVTITSSMGISISGMYSRGMPAREKEPNTTTPRIRQMTDMGRRRTNWINFMPDYPSAWGSASGAEAAALLV